MKFQVSFSVSSILFLLLLQSSFCLAQNVIDLERQSLIDSIHIQKISLEKNKILHKAIVDYINELNDKSALFKKGFGFLTIRNYHGITHAPVLMEEFNKYAKDTIAYFNISACSYVISESFSATALYCQDCFPTYYTFIEGRLILIYDEFSNWLVQNQYFRSSRKEIIDLVNFTLKEALNENFEFVNFPKSTTFKISKEERKSMTQQQILEKAAFTLNEGKKVIIHFDKSVTYSN